MFFPRLELVVFFGFWFHNTVTNKAACVSFSRSEGRTSINIIDPAFESKIRAKVADVFPFMKDKDVSEHYKMIEQVLEDEKMVNQRFFRAVSRSARAAQRL